MDSRLQELLRTGPGSIPGDSHHRGRWWSRISTVYVVAVVSLAAAGFLAWMNQSPRHALEVTVAILVVTCPCAIGLATPLAAELIHFALRKRGVFLRQASFLDKALSVRKILLDKTGTLTLGRLVLTPASRKTLWQLIPSDKDRLWNMVARSNHPVSCALAEALGGVSWPHDADEDGDGTNGYVPQAQIDFTAERGPSRENVTEIPGRGLEWCGQGKVYRLGKKEFALAETEPSTRDDEIDHPTLFSVDGQVIAAFRFSEEFRNDAAEELTMLREDGYDIHLLSGDTPAKVARAAAALGIPAHKARGGLTPETKASWVTKLDRRDSLMVGDGLNDSPSFAAALCAATPAIDRPVLPGKADFYFLGDGIAALRRALRSATRLRRIVRDNLILAVLYNLAAVSLCFAGLVTPVIAAILMPLSSVTVVGLTAYRLSGRRLAWMS
jgi:Cu2+-exporting ATPase